VRRSNLKEFVATARQMKMILRKPSMPPPSMERTQWVFQTLMETVGKSEFYYHQAHSFLLIALCFL
jgi:hypothetical protein